MSDFELGGVGVQVDAPSLVKPPVHFLLRLLELQFSRLFARRLTAESATS